MRYNMFRFLETIDNYNNKINYYDIFSAKFTNFKYNESTREHTVTEKESERFYLISQIYYDDVSYSDILFLINGLTDPFNIKPGIKIIIPTLEDIESLKRLIREPYTNDERYDELL